MHNTIHKYIRRTLMEICKVSTYTDVSGKQKCYQCFLFLTTGKHTLATIFSIATTNNKQIQSRSSGCNRSVGPSIHVDVGKLDNCMF